MERMRASDADADHNQEPTQDDDAALVQRTLAGEHDAFTALYERYKSAVYTHAYYRLRSATEAEDALQEVFQRAYLRLETFAQERPFRAWLLTIATNYCTDMLRRRLALKRFVQQVPIDVVDFWLADTAANPETSALRDEQRERVRQALRDLPANYREVMVLYYWNDLSYREIADATGLTESTIKTRLFRGREQLTRLLKAQQDNEATT
jgi:RNA polymerase sigma-70 factor (ECF subfamily)